jgi:hypothetical protein
MTKNTDDWLDEDDDWFDISVSRARDDMVFHQMLDGSRPRWENPKARFGFADLGPITKIGHLELLSRYAEGDQAASIGRSLDEFKKEVLAILRGVPSSFADESLKSIHRNLEDFDETVQRLRKSETGQLRDTLSINEFEGDFLDPLEDTFHAVLGLESVGIDVASLNFKERMNRLRDGWATVVDKLAEALRGQINPERIDAWSSQPPDYWWYRMLSQALYK